jgi:hypothetical protein
MAERTDPRPMLPVPAPDAPWLPMMAVLNTAHDASKDRIPPSRNIGIEVALPRRVNFADLHAFHQQEEEWS